MPTPRHLHVGLSIGLALVSLTVGFGAVDLVSPWVLHEGTQVTDVGFGTLTGLVIPIGLLTQIRRSTICGAGVLQTGVAALAFLFAGLLAGETPLILAAAAVAAATASLVLLHPARRRLLPPSQRPSVPLLLLALAACAPGSPIRTPHVLQPTQRRPPRHAHLGLQHWAALSAAAIAALLTALHASFRPDGFPVPAYTVSTAVLAWGATCLAYPNSAGSLSPTWSWLAIVWAATFALAARRESRH